MFFGMNVDSIMVSPFKKAASSADSPLAQATAPNAFGGVGYVTPRAAGELVPHMQKWGMDKATFTVLTLSLVTLGLSWMLGINGVNPTSDFSLLVLALPMVVLVLASSLLRSAAPLLLNHYKDPQMRTAANLQMSTFQQFSRVLLAAVTLLWPRFVKGGNDFVAVPAATIIGLFTLALFINTPMWDNVRASLVSLFKKPEAAKQDNAAEAKDATTVQQDNAAAAKNTTSTQEDPAAKNNKKKEPKTAIGRIAIALWKGLKQTLPPLAKGLAVGVAAPFVDGAEWLKHKFGSKENVYTGDGEEFFIPGPGEKPSDYPQETEEKAKEKAKAVREARYTKLYQLRFMPQEETKQSLLRVTLAYASYAASVMLLNQVAGTALGKNGQAAVMAFAVASLLVRRFATKWVGKGKFSDDQLTGISFAGLALMPLALGLLPYEGGAWAIAALMLFGIGLNMSTAVPGQLDNTRLQNNVTAMMQGYKTSVLHDTSLSEAEKQAKIKDLEEMEKTWAGLASKSYSKANANGIYGVYVAVLASAVFSMLGIAEGADLSGWAARLIFLYSAVVAGVGAWKTRHMTGSFLRALFKKQESVAITAEDVASGAVSAKTFGLANDTKKANALALSLWKGKKNSISTLKNSLAPYGVVTISSEVKMTNILKRMIEIQNRLVAVSEVTGIEAVRPAFEDLYLLALDYQKVLEQSNLSESLNRQFAKLVGALCLDGELENDIAPQPSYMEEGHFQMPKRYQDLLQAKDLINELEVLAKNIRQGGSAVYADTYNQFFRYHSWAKSLLQRYAETNPSETGRVKMEEARIRRICRGLKLSNDRSGTLRKNAGTSTPEQDIQNLEDILQGY